MFGNEVSGDPLDPIAHFFLDSWQVTSSYGDQQGGVEVGEQSEFASPEGGPL